MKKCMKYVYCVFSLTTICAVVAIALAVTNNFTAPIIKERLEKEKNSGLVEVLPSGEGFSEVSFSEGELPSTVTQVFKAENGGYVITLKTAGYGPNFIIMCGIDAEGRVTGTKVLDNSETLGYEKTYGKNLVGADIESIDSVDTIGGATKTTQAYKNAIKDALGAAIKLSGGEVDLRTEEEILNDNLKEALPDADKFTEVFITDDLEDITGVYSADNGTGYVFVSGENFVATDNSGKVISSVDATLKTKIEAAAEKLIGVRLTEIDISKYSDMPTAVEEAFKTSNGDYVLILKAAGYGINGGNQYHPASGEYIKIKVSATASGKIIKCLTLSQQESENIGDACAKPEFYSQFNGKTDSNYEEIDGISGATITTDGYKKAIGQVFDAVKILEGGAK